ncbi:hypothetical protein SO802_001292 [Lithocarpus litseifolius]|uniref:Uncharacterized protein n=1 Tax=Lithocarpus litseifolius TaxID=425828 RepID=A0AAW2DUA2_9ROSI
MSPKTSNHMKWHANCHVNDGLQRHPTDSEAWKSFDSKYIDFSSKPHNVRLGLASDGFNPYGNMSSTHSTWLVILIPYNLPSWMCMKRSSFMLSLLIPGPTSPGNDINVYLQTLVEELKELWDVGVKMFDVSFKKSFQMHVALLWTINDFPAYCDITGWSTKGALILGPTSPGNDIDVYLQTLVEELKELWDVGVKMFDVSFKKSFQIHVALLWTINDFPAYCDILGWSTKDALNVIDNIIGKLLNLDGKTKDNLKAHQDLKDMGIRSELHLKKVKND